MREGRRGSRIGALIFHLCPWPLNRVGLLRMMTSRRQPREASALSCSLCYPIRHEDQPKGW